MGKGFIGKYRVVYLEITYVINFEIKCYQGTT